MKTKAPAALRPESVLASLPYGKAECAAMYALFRGTADPEQQQRALNWIIDVIARTDDLGYEPGEAGARDTIFLQGRRFCGLEIRKMIRINPAIVENEHG